jgi:hypothetical protein
MTVTSAACRPANGLGWSKLSALVSVNKLSNGLAGKPNIAMTVVRLNPTAAGRY